jgi:hypothetical protein
MITISATRRVQEVPDRLIDRIWSGVEWKRNRSAILGHAIEYDDGLNQSVQVCVEWGSRRQAVTILRFRDSAWRISFFSSRPPEGFVMQTGVWEARSIGGRCSLRLSRCLELQRRCTESVTALRSREAAYGKVLQDQLTRVLDLVTEHEWADA